MSTSGVSRWLRTLALPAEFRVNPASTRRSLGGFSRSITGGGTAEDGRVEKSDAQPELDVPSRAPALDDEVLTVLCTGVWRVRRRMIDPATGSAKEDMRMPFRHLESVWDTLASSGVEIRDHTGDPVPEYGSLALDVLAYQPTPGLTRDRIIDTIKPSIYIDGRMVQMGQVIVGTPEGEASDRGKGSSS